MNNPPNQPQNNPPNQPQNDPPNQNPPNQNQNRKQENIRNRRRGRKIRLAIDYLRRNFTIRYNRNTNRFAPQNFFFLCAGFKWNVNWGFKKLPPKEKNSKEKKANAPRSSRWAPPQPDPPMQDYLQVTIQSGEQFDIQRKDLLTGDLMINAFGKVFVQYMEIKRNYKNNKRQYPKIISDGRSNFDKEFRVRKNKVTLRRVVTKARIFEFFDKNPSFINHTFSLCINFNVRRIQYTRPSKDYYFYDYGKRLLTTDVEEHCDVQLVAYAKKRDSNEVEPNFFKVNKQFVSMHSTLLKTLFKKFSNDSASNNNDGGDDGKKGRGEKKSEPKELPSIEINSKEDVIRSVKKQIAQKKAKKKSSASQPVQEAGENPQPVQEAGENPQPVQEAGENPQPVQEAGENPQPVQDAGENPQPVQEAGENPQPVQEAGENPQPVQEAEAGMDVDGNDNGEDEDPNPDEPSDNAANTKDDFITAEELKMFLSIIYPISKPIEKDNLHFCLEIGRKLQSATILHLCQRYIENNFGRFTNIQLLRLADKYNIALIGARVLRMTDTVSGAIKLRDACLRFNDVGEETIKALERRINFPHQFKSQRAKTAADGGQVVAAPQNDAMDADEEGGAEDGNAAPAAVDQPPLAGQFIAKRKRCRLEVIKKIEAAKKVRLAITAPRDNNQDGPGNAGGNAAPAN